MIRTPVIKAIFRRDSLPFWTTSWLYKRSHSFSIQAFRLAKVHYIENNSLIRWSVLNSKVKPDSKARITSIWSDKQVVFKFCDVVYSTKVSTFKASIENQMAFLWLSIIARWKATESRNISHRFVCFRWNLAVLIAIFKTVFSAFCSRRHLGLWALFVVMVIYEVCFWWLMLKQEARKKSKFRIKI